MSDPRVSGIMDSDLQEVCLEETGACLFHITSVLTGPDGTEKRVAAMYFRVEEQLEQRGLAALSLDLDPRGAWTFRLNNGVTVRLGAASVEQRLTRFFAILDLGVSMNAEQVAYVDMRYPNGFVIGWRQTQSAGSDSDIEVLPSV